MKYTFLFFVALILNNTSYFESNNAITAIVYVIYGIILSKLFDLFMREITNE